MKLLSNKEYCRLKMLEKDFNEAIERVKQTHLYHETITFNNYSERLGYQRKQHEQEIETWKKANEELVEHIADLKIKLKQLVRR